jgi:hypothetical protein
MPVRDISLQVMAPGSTVIPNVLGCRISYGFDVRVSECRITTPVKPSCTYDDELTVVAGVIGSNVVTRFVGLVRDFQYQNGAAQVVTMARGYLTRAVEYELGEDTVDPAFIGLGGLILDDLLGTPTGTASQIVQAVLTRANVPYVAADIGSTTAIYGESDPIPFLWHSGGVPLHQIYNVEEQGESAMSYIERYDAIDASYSGGSTGGRYRTYETLAGQVRRDLIGGRPSGTPDFTLTGEVDILDGHFQRSIVNTRNYFVVKGHDAGAGNGPYSFALQQSNPFQPATTKHTYMFSSDMIERGDSADPGNGMTCEIECGALSTEYNREIVSGWLETFRDDSFGPGQTHLVQGAPGGLVGQLGVAENLWLQSLEISVDNRGFTQRLTYIGGGVP